LMRRYCCIMGENWDGLGVWTTINYRLTNCGEFISVASTFRHQSIIAG
jgi:hypothetical protein